MDIVNDSRSVGKYSMLLFTQELEEALYDLRYMFGLLVVLILVDYWFGVRESHAKGIKVRLSRSWRRTMNKFVDYFVFPIVGMLVGIAICEPLHICSHLECTAAFVCVVMACELNSILGHFFKLKGIDFDTSKFLLSLVRSKREGIADAIEDGMKTKGEDTQTEKKGEIDNDHKGEDN